MRQRQHPIVGEQHRALGRRLAHQLVMVELWRRTLLRGFRTQPIREQLQPVTNGTHGRDVEGAAE